VFQCFKCQGFGHKADSALCPLFKTYQVICFYRSGDHRSKNCPVKNVKENYEFVNWKKSKFSDVRLKENKDTSTNKECPVMQRERNHFIKLTDLQPKN